MSKKTKQYYLDRIAGLRPIDDVLMSAMFDDNLPLGQLLLDGLAQNKLFIQMYGHVEMILDRIVVQKQTFVLDGSYAPRFDIYAHDTQGRHYNFEVQCGTRGFSPQRARRNVSALDRNIDEAGTEAKNMPEAWTILLTEYDRFGEGESIYPVERVRFPNHAMFQDGSHILYWNTSYIDDSLMGKINHDLHCANPDEMFPEPFRARAEYLKRKPKGVKDMCEVMQEMYQEGKEDGREEASEERACEDAKALLKDGLYSAERIAELMNLPLSVVLTLK